MEEKKNGLKIVEQEETTEEEEEITFFWGDVWQRLAVTLDKADEGLNYGDARSEFHPARAYLKILTQYVNLIIPFAKGIPPSTFIMRGPKLKGLQDGFGEFYELKRKE